MTGEGAFWSRAEKWVLMFLIAVTAASAVTFVFDKSHRAIHKIAVDIRD